MASVDEREARYAEEIRSVEHRRALIADVDLPGSYASAVMAVADEEHAALTAEVERLRQDKATFEGWRDEWIAATERNEARLAAEEDRAEAAEAREAALRARIEALADKWGRCEPVVGYPGYEEAYQDAERELRAALASPAVADPTEQQAQGGA